MSDNRTAGLRGTSYELFLVLLSLLSIVNAVLIVVPFLSGAGREVVIVMETLLTPVFLIDFLLRLTRSRPRTAYLVHAFGWADLLAIVPCSGSSASSASWSWSASSRPRDRRESRMTCS